MNPNTPVTESIDQRILKLLGLEETFDLDYGTYFTLLKEALVKYSVIGKEKIPTEDLELLKNELKRVRVKEKTKTFKIDQKKFLGKKTPNVAKVTANKTKLLPSSPTALVKKNDVKDASKDVSKEVQKKQPVDILSKIDEKLSSILQTLISLSKFEDKKFQLDRRERENRRRQERESGLEKGGKLVGTAVQKILAPFQNIFERIWNFIKFTLLGRAFTMLMNWFADPKNAKKVQVLGRFLKDWWPALLAAYALFMTPFGGFVRGIVKLVTGFSGRIIKLIPQLLNIIKGLGGAGKGIAPILSNPFVWFPAAVTGAAILGNEVTGQRKAASVQTENKARAQTGKGLGTQGTDTMRDKSPSVGNMGATTPYGLLQGASRGAIIQTGYDGIDKNTGIPITGAGKDTQLIAAREGEIVLTPEHRQQVYDKTGYDVAELVKDNKPNLINSDKIKLFGKTPLMNIGGIVGFNKGGIVGNKKLGKTSSRSAWDALNTVRTPLKYAIGDAKKRLFDFEGFKNRNIDNNVRPWWQRLNPFRDNRTFADRLPGKPIENYRMPGFDLERWKTLKEYRETPQEEYKPNPKSPKLRYAPGMYYRRPGIDRPLMLKGGGLIEALEKTYIQGQKSGTSSDVLKAIGDEAFLLKHFGGTWRNFRGSGASNMRGEPLPIQKKQDGGHIKGSFSRGTKQFGEIPLIRAALASGIKGRELAAFLAQMSHETGGFKWSRELGRGKGMDYSGGDMYHGRGYTQLTHDYNYRDFGNKLGVDLLKDPDLLLKDPNLSAKVAIQYWKERVRPSVKNWDDVFSHSAAINLPSATDPSQIRGYEDRLAKYNYYSQNLNPIITRSLPKKTDPKVNRQKLIDKRPWWDKFGWFGGASRQIKKKQGGGRLIDLESRIDKMINRSLPQTLMDYNQQVEQGQSQPIDPKTFKQELERQKYNTKMRLLRNYLLHQQSISKRNSGGSITPVTTRTGYDIPGSMLGADTQYLPEYNTAVQPGEELFKFVITKKAAQEGLGEKLLSYANKQQSLLDNNSNAAKTGFKSKNVKVPQITPYSADSMSSTITLPPIEQSIGGKMQTPSSPTDVPVFSAFPSDSNALATRKSFADMYGIVG